MEYFADNILFGLSFDNKLDQIQYKRNSIFCSTDSSAGFNNAISLINTTRT